MSDSINLTLTIGEANLILEALGNIPYHRVYELIGKIQHVAQEQLEDMASVQDKKNGGEHAE